MHDEPNTSVDYWQAAKKLLGGSVFCGLVGATCEPWTGIDSFADAMIMGGAIGAVLGAYIVMSFEDVHVKISAMLFAKHSSHTNANLPPVGFARGVILARFVCLFLMPPFLVVFSFALVGLSFVLAVFGNGLDGTIELAHGLFWFIGLYFSNTFLVAAGSWVFEGLVWIRSRGRKRSSEIPA